MAQLDKPNKKGKVYKYKNTLFWAQGGAICTERTNKDGDYKVITLADWRQQAGSILQCLQAGVYFYGDERNEAENFVRDAAAAYVEAKAQGDPMDPKVMGQKARDLNISKGYIYLGDGSMHSFDRNPLIPDDNLPAKEHKINDKQKINIGARSQGDYPNRKKLLPEIGKGGNNAE